MSKERCSVRSYVCAGWLHHVEDVYCATIAFRWNVRWWNPWRWRRVPRDAGRRGRRIYESVVQPDRWSGSRCSGWHNEKAVQHPACARSRSRSSTFATALFLAAPRASASEDNTAGLPVADQLLVGAHLSSAQQYMSEQVYRLWQLTYY